MRLDLDANDMGKGGELGHLEGEGGPERKSQQPEPNEQLTDLGVKEKEKMPNETFKGGGEGRGIKGENRTGQISGRYGRGNSQQDWLPAWLRRMWGITGWAERMVLRALVEPGGSGEKGQGSLPACREDQRKRRWIKHRRRSRGAEQRAESQKDHREGSPVFFKRKKGEAEEGLRPEKERGGEKLLPRT